MPGWIGDEAGRSDQISSRERVAADCALARESSRSGLHQSASNSNEAGEKNDREYICSRRFGSFHISPLAIHRNLSVGRFEYRKDLSQPVHDAQRHEAKDGDENQQSIPEGT